MPMQSFGNIQDQVQGQEQPVEHQSKLLAHDRSCTDNPVPAHGKNRKKDYDTTGNYTAKAQGKPQESDWALVADIVDEAWYEYGPLIAMAGVVLIGKYLYCLWGNV